MLTDTTEDMIVEDMLSLIDQLEPVQTIRIEFKRDADLTDPLTIQQLEGLMAVLRLGHNLSMRYRAQMHNLTTVLNSSQENRRNGWGGYWSYQLVVPKTWALPLLVEMVKGGLITRIELVES